MKIDIMFRDLDAREAAIILQMGKANGAELALFLATPGQPVASAAPAAVAAATGSPDPTGPPPPAARAASASAAPESSTLPAPGGAGTATTPSAPDFLTFSRAPSVKAIVKVLVESGTKEQAAIFARCTELRDQGVPALAAVPADQLADRIAGSMASTEVQALLAR